jgi:pimeloyl-ACP methyl ester carboxylesterase
MSVVKLEAREAGSGPPLLLLHGWPQHSGAWSRVLPRLAESYRVLAPDLRGLGRSPAPPGDYRKHTLLADVLAFLDERGVERFRVIGHDWGGWLTWLLVLEHPWRVERAIALDIVPPVGDPLTLRRVLGAAAFFSYQYVIASPWLGEHVLRTRPGFVRALLRGSSARRDAWSPGEVEEYARLLQQPERARASVGYYRQFLLRELPRIVLGIYTRARLDVPLLAIYGERSQLFRAFGPAAPRPNLRVEVLPGVGHNIPDEAPAELLELAEPFLAAEDPAVAEGSSAA